MKIDEIDAEYCDGKLYERFPQFLTKAVFPSKPSIDLIVEYQKQDLLER